jgi:hypothetical protein
MKLGASPPPALTNLKLENTVEQWKKILSLIMRMI